MKYENPGVGQNRDWKSALMHKKIKKLTNFTKTLTV